MKPRDRCCCAIPTVNAGVYTILVEQLALGITAGTLAIATTHIVGAATWPWSKWIFAIVCYVAAVVQIFGFLGVAQEKPITFRRYLTLHIMTTLAGFSVAIAWIVISAARHSTAKSNCESTFFSTSNSTSSAVSSEGETLCQIFPWVDVGLMGGLWVLLAISQFYFYVVLSGYSRGQQEDHMKYDSLYSVNGYNNEIPMTKRDPWDAREESPSPPLAGGPSGTRDGYGHPFPDYPQNARTYEAQPTPYFSDPYYTNNPPVVGGVGDEPGLNRPQHSQSHPGQSSP